jgi:hypothetical protein
MYASLPNFILGFHGCDQSVADDVINGKTTLVASQNDYDWLGHGIYFWENNPSRALEYAQVLRNNPERNNKSVVKEPAVLGVIIDLGFKEKNHIQICIKNPNCIKGFFKTNTEVIL